MPVDDIYIVAAILMDMFREEIIFMDPVGYRCSTKKQEGYETYSFYFNKKYPGYKINNYD